MTSYEQPLIDHLLRIIRRWRRRSRRFSGFQSTRAAIVWHLSWNFGPQFPFKVWFHFKRSKTRSKQAWEVLQSRPYNKQWKVKVYVLVCTCSADPETYSLIKIQNATKRTETWTKTLVAILSKNFFNLVRPDRLPNTPFCECFDTTCSRFLWPFGDKWACWKLFYA